MTDRRPAGRLALRVDVDTHVGMRDGVPALLETFAAHGGRGTFYLSMGPDRAGRAVLNLLRSGFLAKMRRTGALGVYGPRTVLSGLLLPARPIARAMPEIARRIPAAGHEVGVHAWDHRAWQDGVLRWPAPRVRRELDRGRESFRETLGESPRTFAAPAWITRAAALRHQETFDLEYASDCRGDQPFLPAIDGVALRTPQVPTTLPTLDEALGSTAPDAGSYFRDILARIEPPGWHALTIHAELEGGRYREGFAAFLDAVHDRGIACVTQGELLAARRRQGDLPVAEMTHGTIEGRHGVLSMPAPR